MGKVNDILNTKEHIYKKLIGNRLQPESDAHEPNAPLKTTNFKQATQAMCCQVMRTADQHATAI